MNNRFLGNGRGIIAFLAVAILVQLQLGCSLIKSGGTGGSESGNSTAAASNSAGQKADASSGKSETPEACRNAYYPVSPNVERKYSVKYQKMANLNQDYTEKFSNFTGDGFTSNSTFKDVTSNINWRCLPEGLLATQYGNTIDFKQGGGAKIETISSSGISYPAESHWNTGEKWTTHYDIKETMTNQNTQATGMVEQNGEILSAEEITVPAGTFQTMKAKVNLTLDLTVKVGGMTVPTKTNVETTAWFAKDVGMVKTVSTIGNLDTGTVELLSYSGTK